MNAKHQKIEQIEEAYAGLQIEHKSLLEKNQNDLIRIRQSEAQLKKALEQIERQRRQWNNKEQHLEQRVKQLAAELELLKCSKENSEKSHEGAIAQLHSKLRSQYESLLQKESQKSESLSSQVETLTAAMQELERKYTKLTENFQQLSDKSASLEKTNREVKAVISGLQHDYSQLELSSKKEIDSLTLQATELTGLLEKSERRSSLILQTHQSDEHTIDSLRKELTVNKELVKSLQTIIKVKEFEIERLSEQP